MQGIGMLLIALVQFIMLSSCLLQTSKMQRQIYYSIPLAVPEMELDEVFIF